MSEKEKWLPVVGYEVLYEVSNLGRVRSLDRRSSDDRCAIKGRILRQSFHTTGYLKVALWCGTGITRKIHILVLEAFVGPRPVHMDGCHCDGNVRNNKLSNLRWDTRKNNLADRCAHGTDQIGERNPSARLNATDVERIFDLSRSGCSQQQVSDWLGCSQANVGLILRGETWAHLGLAKPIGNSIFGPAPGSQPPMQVNP